MTGGIICLCHSCIGSLLLREMKGIVTPWKMFPGEFLSSFPAPSGDERD
ncbi:Uncharacterized protein dnm_080330 [Desulfonema magnum]|uniref:Uncharacterized protein n=1 Tax=Desulfonema magnum TaxID=45655 RepID=A0A975BVM9_9BACT|nr:Uncharacterized protein dnm_080330 [Desulfonema magnum]